nr:toxin co-regulated pilus biosynthesis Q family protein [Serratia fonticola]
MKIIHTSMLLPVLLGGCSLPGHRPVVSDAQQFVDTQISTNLKRIELAQKSLQQASATVQPVRLPTAITPVKNISPGSLRGLTNIKSLGSPEPFKLVTVNSKDLQMEQMLYKIVPSGWNVVISENLKNEFKQRISLVANDQWPYILDSLLRQYGWVAMIDWPKKQVSVAYKTPEFSTASKPSIVKTKNAINTSPVTTSPRNPFSNSQNQEKQITSVPSTPTTKAPPESKVLPVPQIWRIETGSTLKDVLFSWASAEKCSTPGVGNWTVAWLTSVNYRIDAPLKFEGSFRDALNSLFTLYGTAKVPLYAGIRNAQCVISVDDKEIH